MADITASELSKHITEFLKDADLSKVTSKLVRKEVGEKLGIDLTDRKKEIDKLVMSYVENQVSSEEVSDEETREKGSDAEDYSPTPKKKAAPSKKRKAADSDSDEDWEKKKKKPAKSGGGRKKQSAFTKSFRLSPELADVVGQEVMPRHEVVKKLWAVIKERNLQDPKQKQFVICDDQLLKVFGIKRFRTFGMMKHLKDHFVESV